MVTALVLSSVGCAHKRIQVDYRGFELAFAETSNREMLLNLARLQNHDPTYFFKMGQISSQYRFNASLSGNASYALQGTVPGGAAPTGGGTPGLIYENTPTFQFIPVNDETNAQLLLKPIPPETFYILYQQGWRIDQLLRLMVDRIEVTTSAADGCHVITYPNSLPFAPRMTETMSPQALERLSKYVSFLRIAAIAYGLQTHGDLLLRGVSSFSRINGEAPVAAPNADVIEKAAEKNLVFETVDGKSYIGQKVTSPRFFLLPPMEPRSNGYKADTKTISDSLTADPVLTGLQTGAALKATLDALQEGFTIEGDVTPGNQADPCPTGKNTSSVHLVLRSLIGVMAAAAQEESSFDQFFQGNPMLPGAEQMRFNDAIPKVERLPVLRISWKSREHTPPLTSLSYHNISYSISDDKAALLEQNQYWNHDVFRLISALSAQVTVDISKFPIPNVLSIHN